MYIHEFVGVGKKLGSECGNVQLCKLKKTQTKKKNEKKAEIANTSNSDVNCNMQRRGEKVNS